MQTQHNVVVVLVCVVRSQRVGDAVGKAVSGTADKLLRRKGKGESTKAAPAPASSSTAATTRAGSPMGCTPSTRRHVGGGVRRTQGSWRGSLGDKECM